MNSAIIKNKLNKYKTMEKTIYKLDLHESLYDKNIKATIIRVPSGWLYKYEKEIYNENQEYYYNVVIQIVFVPYNGLFEDLKK